MSVRLQANILRSWRRVAAHEADGAPAWVIQDPVINRFYRIGWLEFECLLRWGAPAGAVASDISSNTPLQAEPAQVLALAGFLDQHQLLRPGSEATDRLAARSGGIPWLKWNWWLHHYLFFRVPLVRPQAFLSRLADRLRPLFQPATLWFLALLGGLGLLLVYREWDVFSQAVVDSLSPQGLLGFAGALFLAKTLHEMGHALVATHYGVRVAHMGIAFVVMWPMLYTDTSESWKLRSRHQRLAVSAAGILTELALAGIATLGWALSEPGWFHTGCLYLATTSWMLSLALNVSPFMRFDGYFILSDLLDFPNLHERSTHLAKVALRRTLLRLNEPWPEDFPISQRRLLVGFALMTWLYRLVVFLGIAVAVYLFFFKILGIFLFIVELAWFVALPIWRELKVWWARREAIPGARRRLLMMIGGALLVIGVMPWKTEVRGPGVAHAARQSAVFAPYPAQILQIRASGKVSAGDVLVQLDAPDLRAQDARSEARAQALSSQLTGLQAMEHGLEQFSTTHQRLGEQQAELQASGDELGRLKLQAAFPGIWLDLDPQKQTGAWVNTKEPLGMLIDPQHWQVDAFVGQEDIERLSPGASAIFYLEHHVDALRGKIIGVDPTPVSRLDHPMLATRYGGPIPLAAHSQELIPAEPRYRVRVDLSEVPTLTCESRGQVVIDGTRRSLLGEGLTSLLAIVIRESGF